MSYAHIPRRILQCAILLPMLVVALLLGLSQTSGASAATSSASAPIVIQPHDDPSMRSVLAYYEAMAGHAQTATAPRTYTVHSGNTLSGIAQRFYGSTKSWPCVYDANKAHVHNPNDIYVGQVLSVPVHLKLTGCTAPIVMTALVTETTAATPTYAATASTSTSGSYGSVSPGNYSGYQACVISRESSGDSQIMNSSGHYGLYQFSESTWEAYGGAASTFGHASVAQQNQVFNNAMAQGGQSNWSPYDGC